MDQITREEQESIQEIKDEKLHHFQLRMLSELAKESVDLSSGEEIFRLIGKQLEELIPGSIIVSYVIDHEKELIIPKFITSLGHLTEKVKETIGMHPDKISLPTKDMDIVGLSSGRLLKMDGGLNELTRNLIPKAACKILEKSLKISEVYQAGCAWKGTLYGGVAIFLTHNKLLEEKQMIQIYVDLASIVLQQKFTQEALGDRELLYQDLFDNAPDMYFTVFPDGKVKSVNLYGANYLGYSKEELVGDDVWKVVHPEDLEEVKGHISEILKNKIDSSELEFRKIRKDGTTLSVQERVQLILDEESNPIEIRIICRDVSDKKKSENDLIDRESQIRTILKYSPVPQIIEDFKEAKKHIEELKEKGVSDIKQYFRENPDDFQNFRSSVKIIEANNSFLNLFKAEGLEKLAKNVHRIITQQSSEMFTEGLLHLIAGEDSFASETVYKDLESNRVEAITRWAVVPGHEESLNMIVVSMEDMTERNRANTQLQILSSAVDYSPVSIIITNPVGLIQYVNPKFLEISGYEKIEIVGKEVNKLPFTLVPELLFEDLLAYIQEEKVWNGEFQNKRKDGETYWEFAFISAVRNEAGRLDHIVAIKEDISERKKGERELIEAKTMAEESDKLKTAFLANMSHEIRTPMNAIVGFSELLKDPALPFEQRSEFSNILTSSCDTLSAIIDDIVDIAKIEAGQTKIKYSDCLVDEIMHELYTFYFEEVRKTGKNVELKLSNSCKSVITTDKARLIQILSNLLDNAVKFTNKGFIEFGCRHVDNPPSGNMEGLVEFFITDTGIGIPEEMHGLIFDRFRQIDNSTSRKHGGTGLGLAISKNLIELLGGKIWLESKEGEGTTFSFSLPVKPDTKEPVLSSSYLKISRAQERWPGKTIMIVEDNHANWEFFKATLTKTGVKLVRASNGEEAINFVKSNDPPNLVLMDIQMPDINGYEITKIIKGLHKDLPVVAQTAYAMPQDREKALSAGCDDYLPKPIKPVDLLSIITKYI